MTKDIRILRLFALHGPNLWTYRPCVEAWVDIGELEDCPSNTLPGFTDRLIAWLPGLLEHRCSEGCHGGFVSRLREGTWPAHIIEHVAIELQTRAGMKVGFGKARSTPQRGVYKLVVRTRAFEVGKAAVLVARDLVMAAIEDRPFDVAACIEALRAKVDAHWLGPSTAAIVGAAIDRGIPWLRLNDGNLVQLGLGKKQRRIWTAETDATSAIAESIACDKQLTRQLLKSVGVPVPQGRIVESPAAAWEAAADIGLPVVVKPSDANHGRGVSLELTLRTEVEAAFAIAEAEGSEVIVERFIAGDEHRLLVVGGKLVAAAKGENLYITGDGHSTVRQLIDAQLNSDPRRGEAEEFPLETIVLDREPAMQLLLARQKLDGEAVPEAGRRVLVQRNGNVAIDVTDKVHPEVAARAVLAAKTVGLDIAGIDLVCSDISRPLEETGGAIVEVNAGPGLLMHLKPAQGQPRPVGPAIVDHLFPPGEDGRIDVVGITGSRLTAEVGQRLAWLGRLAGRKTGLACRTGLYLDERRITASDASRWPTATHLLTHRTLDLALFTHTAQHILDVGLPYDRCRVGIVLDAGGLGTLDEWWIDDEDKLFAVLRTQIDVVLPGGAAVLAADDERLLAMQPLCDGETILFAPDENTAIARQRSAGGRALFFADEMLMLAQGASLQPLIPVSRCQGCGDDEGRRALLAALAAGWALGFGYDLLRTGAETFGFAGG